MPISIDQLWERCPEDYFVRNTPKQIAWHTSLLVDLVEALLVKISNRFSLGGTEVFIYCQDQPHLFNKVVSTIGAKIQYPRCTDYYNTRWLCFDSFIITELNGELVEFDRRRELEQALTLALQSEKLSALSITPNRQLQHFTVQTDVRFYTKTKRAY